jgi:hypothetical protein
MDARDRQLLAGLAATNQEIGAVTLQLLTLQPNDAKYAAALRHLGRDLVRIGAEMAARAGELDGRGTSVAELLADPPAEQSGERP